MLGTMMIGSLRKSRHDKPGGDRGWKYEGET